MPLSFSPYGGAIVNNFEYEVDVTTKIGTGVHTGFYEIDPMSVCDPINTFPAAINDTYNCNKCPNDVDYFQLYEENEKLYVYFGWDDPFSPDITSPTYGWNNAGNPNILISAEVQDLDGNPLYATVDLFCSQWMNAYRAENNSNYQVLEIDTSLISETCWIIKYTLNLRSSSEVFYSEPYRKVNCEETILIEGTFESEDCDGKYYGVFDSAFGSLTGALTYLDKYRVPADLEKDNFDIDRVTTTDSRVISTQKIANYLFRTKRLPEYEADKLINSFSAKTIKLDSVEFTEIQGFSKNNESGSMWIVSVELGIKKNELKFGCN